MIHEFFDRSYSKWNIKDFSSCFLNTALDHHRTLNALTSAWTNSLDAIRRGEEDKESRKSRKAQFLREQWDQDPTEKRIARAAVDAFKMARPSVVNNSSAFFGKVQTVYSGSVEFTDGGSSKRALSLSPTSSDDEARQLRKKKSKKKTKKKQDASGSEWRQRFVDMFNAMDPENKTKLSTGTIVEDVVFAYAIKLEKPAPVHSFIIDAENPALKQLFLLEEWVEIVVLLDSRRKALQEVSLPKCLDWIPDNVTTTAQLRKILYGPEQPQGSDEEWASDVYRQFLFLLEHPDKPLTRDQCENWFEVTLLGRLVNRCIMTLPSVEVLCKESISVATRGHLNQNRTQTGDGNYLLPSPRLDAIFRLIQPGYEFGGCEVGKYDKGPEDTKRIEDFNKLAVTLSHMLRRLHQEVKVACPEELEVVGLLCSGLTLQSLRMHSTNGYLYFLVRYDILRIPAHEKRIRDVRMLLKAMWLVKKTISDTVDMLWSSGDSEAE